VDRARTHEAIEAIRAALTDLSDHAELEWLDELQIYIP